MGTVAEQVEVHAPVGRVPNEHLEWETVGGGVQHHGTVRFEQVSPDVTKVEVCGCCLPGSIRGIRGLHDDKKRIRTWRTLSST